MIINKILKGKKIAIIEDNIINMAVFTALVNKHGGQVIQDPWNRNPAHVLRENLPIDLVLLDIMLPGRSGYEVIGSLKQTQDLKDIPVIAISSLDPATEIPKAKEAGFSGFISKPINANKLPDQLAQCLSGQQIWVTGR